MKRALSFLTLILTLSFGLLAGTASAKTPDGMPPSEETVCDGETGAAFGLCNAYCEAMDCDNLAHRASDTACDQVLRQYQRHTGTPMPCEVACPCGGVLPLFAALQAGTAQITACVAGTQLIGVGVAGGSFVVVDGAALQPFCSVNGEPPLVPLTPQEVTACRDILRHAAAAQGVVCGAPE